MYLLPPILSVGTHLPDPLPYPTSTPYVLQQPISLRQTIQRIIPLAHSPHKAAQGIHLVLARVPAILVYFADGDLHGGVVFGFYDTICCATFAGNVAVVREKLILVKGLKKRKQNVDWAWLGRSKGVGS